MSVPCFTHARPAKSPRMACTPQPRPLAIALHRACVCLTLGAAVAPFEALAQAADPQTLPAVTVSASVDGAGDLPAAYAGGQVARGGRLGLLGNKGVMDTPFATTNYTAQRLEDQQAVTLAEVLGSDPSTRFTGQIGGVTDSFYIRGFPINEGNLSEVAFDAASTGSRPTITCSPNTWSGSRCSRARPPYCMACRLTAAWAVWSTWCPSVRWPRT